ncbi:peptidylprolyl isomerase [Candidatus Woesearchaeota archaeon]|nr:peptidylprolyl isomerase [Candidatus Woesearchaeota archaeon]
METDCSDGNRLQDLIRNDKMAEKGEFIELEYTGRLKDEGMVFDTTSEKTAKEEGIWDKNMKYGPAIVCLGEGQLLSGLDQKLVGKSVGKHTIELAPEEGFGKKDAKLLRIVPTNIFRQQKIDPVPGLQVNIDGAMGTIRTVTGGRTVVDFNHPLSGKEVVYDIDLKRVVKDDKEKVKAFVSLALGLKDLDVDIKDSVAVISTGKEIPQEIAEKLQEEIARLTDIKKITFTKNNTEKEAEKKEK